MKDGALSLRLFAFKSIGSFALVGLVHVSFFQSPLLAQCQLPALGLDPPFPALRPLIPIGRQTLLK